MPLKGLWGCYISIEPTIEIMAEETIDKIGCAIRKGIKNCRKFPKSRRISIKQFLETNKI